MSLGREKRICFMEGELHLETEDLRWMPQSIWQSQAYLEIQNVFFSFTADLDIHPSDSYGNKPLGAFLCLET